MVTRQSVHRFLHVYRETGTIKRWEGSGRPSKLTPTVRDLVEQKMMEDDETTASQLHKYLMDNGILISLSTILRCRTSLGWTFRGSAYCQLIRLENKNKRLEWARQYLHEADSGFEDVVWTDESCIQVETHKRFCYRKVGCAPKSKPRYNYSHYSLLLLPLHSNRAKHPVKVHVWAGISLKGPTQIIIFDGIMDAPLYIEVLRRGLLPFLAEKFPNGHRFMQVRTLYL